MHTKTMVSKLIDKENASWNKEAVEALFLPHEVEEITCILLSAHLPADKQVWACSLNGLFTVRSAYGVAKELVRVKETGSCSDES